MGPGRHGRGRDRVSVHNRGREVLRYDLMLQRALRGVLREALAEVGERGLPGDHHLYITFRTGAPGVEIADFLKARYPDEMTIVLQHEFWGLESDQEKFQVTLSFSSRHERLVVPFAAVIAFADPSVKFGLQFEPTAADKAEAKGAAPAPGSGAPTVIEGAATPAAGQEGEGTTAAAGGGNGQGAGEKVVTLDRFRKK
jgi:hypothetical protein